MKLWKITSALLAASFLTTTGMAQTPEQMQKQFDAMKASMAAQAARISQLESEKSVTGREESVENEINRLSERLAAGTTVASAANKITFAGEFRFRGALTFGDDQGGVNRDGWFNSSKVTLGFLYEFSRDVSAYALLQSAFAFGQNGNTNDYAGGGATPNPAETPHLCAAWIKTSNLFGRPELSAKLGRQAVTLGNQFQFGNADWFNSIYFDGVRYDWNSDSFNVTGLWLRLATSDANDTNQASSFNTGAHDHNELYSVYFTLKSIKNVTIDLYWIYANLHDAFSTAMNGFGSPVTPLTTSNGTDYFHTLGARVAGTADVASGLDWNIEGAYQTGSGNADVPTETIDSFSMEAEVGIMFSKDNKVRAWLRALYAEGATADGDAGYQPLYPNRHSNTASFRARYGSFDIFPMSNSDLITGGVHFDPCADWTVGLNGVWGQLDNKPTFGTAGLASSSDNLGFEIDLWAEYRYSDTLTFAAGGAVLFPDDQMEFDPTGFFNVDGDTQWLFWLQARLFF